MRDAYALACLGNLQSNDTQTFQLTLERTCSSDAHYIGLTYESLSEMQGDLSNLGSNTHGAALAITLREPTSVCPVVLVKWS